MGRLHRRALEKPFDQARRDLYVALGTARDQHAVTCAADALKVLHQLRRAGLKRTGRRAAATPRRTSQPPL
jgi:uncharacterized protein HemY